MNFISRLKHVPPICSHQLYCFILAIQTLCIFPAFGQKENSNPDVLIINSYHQGEAWSDNEIAGIMSTLHNKYPQLAPSIEHLDAKRFPSSEHLEFMRDYLARKYRDHQPDLVMVLDNPAFSLIQQYGESLFPGIPVVFAGVNGFSPDMLAGKKKITGVAEHQDMTGTLEMALKLHPSLRNVLLVHDYTASGQAVRQDMAAVLPKFKGKLDFTYAPDGSIEDLSQTLKQLPENSIVLLLTYVTDKTGRTFSREESTRLISDASPVPVYAMHETRLGFGIIGGMLLEGREHGSQAGTIALQILAGENPDNIPVADTHSRAILDYQVMSRFQIPEHLRPPGMITINRPVSFWEQDRNVLLPAIAVIVALTLTIALLTGILVSRHRTQLALKFEEARLRMATTNSNTGLWDWNMLTNEVFYSAIWKRQIGYEENEIPNRFEEWQNRVHPEDLPLALEQIRNVQEGWQSEYNVEFRFRHKDGSYRWILARGSVLSASCGKPCRLMGSHIDITERKQTEMEVQKQREQLFRAEKMATLGTLVSGIGHEINNPNSFIMLNAPVLETLFDKIMPLLSKLCRDQGINQIGDQSLESLEKRIPKLLHGIQEGSDRIKNIVKALRHYAGTEEATESNGNVNDAVANALFLTNHRLQHVTHQLISECTSEIPPINGETRRIEQVIVNLIINACEALENVNQAIAIRTSFDPTGQMAVIRIEDEGRGIPPEILDRITEPFFTTKRDIGGTGMGLAISLGIVNSLKGSLQFEAGPGGKGTMAIVRLPIATPTPSSH